MKKVLFFIAFITISSISIAQEYSEEEIEKINNTMLRKSYELYQHECLAWYGSDNARNLGIEGIVGYIVIKDEEGPSITFYDENAQNALFSQRLNREHARLEEPDTIKRPLTKQEIDLIDIKGRLIAKILNQADQYEIGCPEDFDLNFIFLPKSDGYEIYITMGTQLHNVIPIGCDFAFGADNDENITDWVKFHKGAIIIPINESLGRLEALEHNHVQYPFFSPTEICVFMLYAPSFGVSKLVIESEYIQRIFTYNIDGHSIKTEKLEPHQ